ncbi:MAG: hypothetical protein L0387_10420 [Acidobacteria bacterium]|nr:hypothetical protein [Acidobacteriota bacterium]
MKNPCRYATVLAAVLGLIALGCEKTPTESDMLKDNVVASIEKAPIVADGNVVSAATDLVINLNTSLDPAVPGRTLLAGRTIKVTLPDEFVNTGSLPLQDIFSSPTCVPGNLQCTSAILLQGWPQHPILPRVPPTPPGQGTPQYSLSLEGKNTIVFTALVDVVPGAPLVGPGIKQIHLILNGFTNPSKPGFYSITVEAQTGPNGEVEQGMGTVQILQEIRPSINVTCAFNQGAPNTIFQKTSPGQLTPLPLDFLLWDRAGNPLEGVTLETVNPGNALLKQGQSEVGRVTIDAPSGATGQEVFTSQPSAVIKAPISGVPTARLTAFFRGGSTTGEYKVSFALNGGNAVQIFVQVL